MTTKQVMYNDRNAFFRVPEVLNQVVTRSAYPLGRVAMSPSCPFQFLGARHPLLCVSPSLQSSRRTLSLDVGPTQIIQNNFILKSFTSLHLQRFISQIRSHSPVPRIRRWTYLFEGYIQVTPRNNHRLTSQAK